jgi:CRP-like cAMP-binding protein
MTINFRLAFMENSTYQFEPAKIRAHYCKGWFLIDLVTLIPWDVISMIVEANSDSGEVQNLKILRLLKILKLTKMIRIMKTASVLKRLQTQLGMNNTTKQLLKYLMIIIALMHWCACSWGMMAAYSESTPNSSATLPGSVVDTIDGSNGSWLRRFEERVFDGERLPTAETYALCLEYSLAVMCMSYSTIVPETSSERWFSLFAMLVSGFVYVYVIGGICSAVAAQDMASLEFQETMDTLMLFFRNILLPVELKMRAFEYLNYCEKIFRDEGHRDVLTIMPPSIRGDICIHQHSKLMHRIPFLEKCFLPQGNGNGQTEEQRALLSFICCKLSQKAYPPREVIYLRNDPATDVFIITRGVVKISGGFIRVPQYLSAGTNFGSDMLMTPAPLRVHAVKSVSYSTHAVLAAEDLLELEEVKPTLFEIAFKNMRLYRNILTTAYLMQEFGKMVMMEVKREVAAKDCTREEASRTVTARFRETIYGSDDGDEKASSRNHLIADRLAAKMESRKLGYKTPNVSARSIFKQRSPQAIDGRISPGLPPLGVDMVAGVDGVDGVDGEVALSRQSKIAVKGVATDRLTPGDLKGLVGNADDASLADLFALQQTVKAQSIEWTQLQSRLKSAIQLRAMNELGNREKKAKAAEADSRNKGKRKSFAD